MNAEFYEVIFVVTEDLKPSTKNPRKHKKRQIRKLIKLIRRFGFTTVIVIDEYGNIIAGEARWYAAKELGLKYVPCIRLEDLTEAELRAYRLADNRITEDAHWNDQLLKIELQTLIELNVDMELTGFEIPEIDLMLHSVPADEEEAEEELPTIPEKPVAQKGDVYALGPHRVICGNTLEREVLESLMDGEQAQMVLTDAPYNVDIPSHARGHGKVQHDNFAMACSEFDSDQFTTFLHSGLLNLSQCCQDGSLNYLFMDWRHLPELHLACKDIFSQQLNLCIWCKNNGGMGSLYRSQYECIAVWKLGTSSHINNIKLGAFGRYRTNVWQYPGLSSFGKDRDTELAIHPTVKPVALLRDAILDATHPNQIVLDGFLGSGSTLIAAEQVHRRCFGVEIDPKYVDVILTRYFNETGDEPIHIESGLTFSELAHRRSSAKGAAI